MYYMQFIIFTHFNFVLKFYSAHFTCIYYSTIDTFKAFGLHRETIVLQYPIQQDPNRPKIRYTTMSWKPSDADIGNHVLCVNVSDNKGFVMFNL
jgi:hypothetical protein